MGSARSFLQHLKAIASWEPTVHAFVGFDEQVAAARSAVAAPGALHGWALGVKDIVDVAGSPTACGVRFLPNRPAARDAEIVGRLRDAGAYVMAKTVTTAFAFFDPGATRNPWNPAHTPGGSSMGSAAAVAAGQLRLAVGTQTTGSVIRPASFCGVVGFKPSYDWIGRSGVFPLSPSVDTIGLFTTDVADMAQTFAALSGRVPQASVDRFRVGLLRDPGCEAPDPAMADALEWAARRLAEAGWDVTEVTVPEACRDAYHIHDELVAVEASRIHARPADTFAGDYPAALHALVTEGSRLPLGRIEQLLSGKRRVAAELSELLARFPLLLAPGAPGEAPRDHATTGDPRMNLLFTHCGVPALTLPAVLSAHGLPLGIQLVAGYGRERLLLAAALQAEDAIGFSARPSLNQAD